MTNGFFSMISRMRYINRWGLMRNTFTENIQEHSHMVAVLAHGLAVIENKHFGGDLDVGQVALVALYHDVSEILTGDLPTPIKYDNPEIQEAYQKVEQIAEARLLGMLPAEFAPDFGPALSNTDPKIHAIVKAADKLSAHIKCVEEVKAGNHEFRLAKEQTMQALVESQLGCLDYFIANFLPQFELTLDELQQSVSY